MLRMKHGPVAAALLVTLIVASATISAGPAPLDFTPHGTQPGLATPIDESQNCSFCHGASTISDADFTAHTTWSGSLMAHATRDPLFWAALDVAERDAPGVGDWCLRCHAPGGWTAGRVRKTGTATVVNGTNGCLLTGDHDDASEQDYGGLGCHFCHRLVETGPAGQTAPQRDSGNFWLDDAAMCGDDGGPCRYGPYAYTSDDPLTPPHAARYSRFLDGSGSCGTCHDVTSPLVGGAPMRTLIAGGVDTGRAFPAERTFTEWKQSRYGEAMLIDSYEAEGARLPPSPARVDCQDCHMRGSTSVDAYACRLENIGSRRGNLPVHEFVGGGSWVLRVLKRLYGGPSQLDRESAFDRTIAWTEELLTQRSATVAVTLTPWAGPGNALAADVRVTNRAGHKLPTGYSEGRRMWLHVVARDATNAVVFESGTWSAATGTLASDAQLKVYEILQGEWDAGTSTCRTTDAGGRAVFHFVRNDCIAKDNRIPPEGFRLRSSADPTGVEIRPVGHVYPETSPGSGVLVHFDVTRYTMPIAANATPPLTVTATLRYQTASREYIEFLRDEAVANSQLSENAMCGRSSTVGPANLSRGQFVYDLWNDPQNGRSPPVTLGTANATTP